jgi:hypothetical protein
MERGMTVATEKRLAYEAKISKMKEEALIKQEERIKKNKEYAIKKYQEYTNLYENDIKEVAKKIKEYKEKGVFYTKW